MHFFRIFGSVDLCVLLPRPAPQIFTFAPPRPADFCPRPAPLEKALPRTSLVWMHSKFVLSSISNLYVLINLSVEIVAIYKLYLVWSFAPWKRIEFGNSAQCGHNVIGFLSLHSPGSKGGEMSQSRPGIKRSTCIASSTIWTVTLKWLADRIHFVSFPTFPYTAHTTHSESF